ncbi:MAG TPA: BrnA antitoxin family protein [Methylocystis sp.]|nr:BrnA antitoxin family protein [Methylocystis sp.]
MTRKTFAPGRGYSKEDWAAVDSPELTDEQLAQATPFAEAFPDLAAAARRGRGPQKAPTKERVTLRLDRAALAAFRATGPGWQSRVDEAVQKAAREIK